jgi:glycosyltransferase involved in cell wall biosynthesis
MRTLIEQANEFFRQKKYDEALETYELVLKETPEMHALIERNIKMINKLKGSAQKHNTQDSGISISVIVPFYNGSKFLERAILSVVNQTVKANEIIIVDDGSEPAESGRCKEICEKYGCIYFYKENGGQGSARNYGVINATSSYVTFLDQDDFYLPDRNEILISGLSDDAGYVYGDAIEADADGSVVRYGMIKEHSIHPKTKLIQLLGQDMFILPSATLICKDKFLSVGGFDERLTGYEDDDLFLRLFRAGIKGVFIDKVVYTWCIHVESTSYSIKMSRSRYVYFSKLVSSFPDDPQKGRFYIKDQIAPRFLPLFAREAVISKINNDKHSEELQTIYSNSIDLLRPYLDREIIARHDLVLKLMRHNDIDLLVNSLYFGGLLRDYGFVQTSYR